MKHYQANLEPLNIFEFLLIVIVKSKYSRTLDCEQLGLRMFYKTSKNYEGILT
jgi:hypothetical protein